MTQTIRRAKTVDVPDIQTLILAAYASAKARIADLPDVAEGVAEIIARENVFVAESADALVGVVMFSVDPPEAHLINVATHPDARGTGLGRRLVELAENAAAANGAEAMYLATHVDLPENVTLYERLGWSVSARTGNKVTMEKALSPN